MSYSCHGQKSCFVVVCPITVVHLLQESTKSVRAVTTWWRKKRKEKRHFSSNDNNEWQKKSTHKDHILPVSKQKKTITMQMLFPLRRICSSFVVFRPSGVFSLHQQNISIEKMGISFVSIYMYDDKARLDANDAVSWVGSDGGNSPSTYNSVTSSRTMLT